VAVIQESSTSQYTLIVISIIGFLTLIVTSLVTMWTASRNRRWDLEDRRERDAKLLKAAEEVKEAAVVTTAAQGKKQEILSAVVEIAALDILHHAQQPMFDLLIDKFKDPNAMSDQELTQFIQRLNVIACDTQLTAQQPAARLMLDAALKQATKRDLQVSTVTEGGENRIAGESMRAEAEPQRNQKRDDGEKDKR
jgi:hypothetical protein